jgi:hypothetical protein
MCYRPVSSAWNWQQNPRVHMQYGQYWMHNPVGIVNVRVVMSFQSVSH